MAVHNTPARWVEYIRAACSSSTIAESPYHEEPWDEWLHDVDLMSVPEVPPAILSLLSPKTVASLALSALLPLSRQGKGIPSIPTAPLKIVSIEFKYLLCYGTDCWVDFRSLTGDVVLLRGGNGCGKSALLEVVCVGVFGEGIPTREVKSQSAAVVCTGRKPGERAMVSVVLDVAGDLYHLHRPLDVKEASSGASCNEATVSRCDGGDGLPTLVASGKSAVEAWVRANVGDIDSFLASSMLTQHNDNDPFAKPGKALVEQIDDLMGNSVTQDATLAVLTASKAHESLLHAFAILERSDVTDEFAEVLSQRLATLEWLHTHMTAYRTFLFKHVIGPQLEGHVNRDMLILRGDTASPLTLSGTWQDAKGMFVWEMCDGARGKVAWSKGGGYQRASIALCMRLALAHISVTGTTSRHLFIDEGFTASDQANMARVPLFLAALRARYDSVIVATHIESLQAVANQELTITEYVALSGKVLSRLQHGRRGEAAPPKKKIGRPKKNAD